MRPRVHIVRLDRQRQRVLVGVAVIVIGLFSLLDNLGLFDAGLVKPLWPLVFVAAGLLRLQQARHSQSGLLVGAGLVVLGAAWILQNYGFMHLRLRDWWPVFLIAGGAMVIARGARPPRMRDALPGPGAGTGAGMGGVPPGANPFTTPAPPSGAPSGPPDSGPQNFDPFSDRSPRQDHASRIDTSVVLSGAVLRNDSGAFQGGEITVTLGGLEIDLRQATMAGHEVVLNVFVLFGGAVITVPPDWAVEVRGVPVLGGIEDKRIPPRAPTQRLVIEGYVIMGGFEIKN